MKLVEIPNLKDPFPAIPEGSGIRMNKSRSRLKNWTLVAEAFSSGIRPESFDEAYNIVKPVCGLYEGEAKAVWDFISSTDIKSIVEVGRNLGSGIFMMSCAAKDLESFMSLDLFWWTLTDPIIEQRHLPHD